VVETHDQVKMQSWFNTRETINVNRHINRVRDKDMPQKEHKKGNLSPGTNGWTWRTLWCDQAWRRMTNTAGSHFYMESKSIQLTEQQENWWLPGAQEREGYWGDVRQRAHFSEAGWSASGTCLASVRHEFKPQHHKKRKKEKQSECVNERLLLLYRRLFSCP
jgi:hypothetical protein